MIHRNVAVVQCIVKCSTSVRRRKWTSIRRFRRWAIDVICRRLDVADIDIGWRGSETNCQMRQNLVHGEKWVGLKLVRKPMWETVERAVQTPFQQSHRCCADIREHSLERPYSRAAGPVGFSALLRACTNLLHEDFHVVRSEELCQVPIHHLLQFSGRWAHANILPRQMILNLTLDFSRNGAHVFWSAWLRDWNCFFHTRPKSPISSNQGGGLKAEWTGGSTQRAEGVWVPQRDSTSDRTPTDARPTGRPAIFPRKLLTRQ